MEGKFNVVWFPEKYNKIKGPENKILCIAQIIREKIINEV